MTSPDDLLTSVKNIVTAINKAALTYLNVNGSTNATGLTTATVVKASAGRVCTISVIVAGSGAGTVYDGTVAGATKNPVFTIPMTAGVYVVNIPTLFGIVVAPGSSQTVSIGFS